MSHIKLKRNDNLSYSKILITTLLLLNAIGLVISSPPKSSRDEHESQSKSQLPLQNKVPLSPSTSSVKCKCQTVESNANNSSSKSEETSKNIEIEIFKSESDLAFASASSKEEIDRIGQVHENPPNDSPDGQTHLPNRGYTSFRNVELFGSSGNFANAGNNKATSNGILLLGVPLENFEGPRRQKREAGDDKVFYVYPVNYNNLPRPTAMTPDPVEKLFSKRSDTEEEEILVIPKDIVDSSLEAAMSNAWKSYGPKESSQPPNNNNNKLSTRAQVQNYHNFPIVNPFQHTQMGVAPWEGRITEFPTSVFEREAPQPGIFSRILSSFIDFEVNNYQVSEFVRKLLFGMLVGTLVVGWIILGLVLNVIPMHWLLLNDKQRSVSNTDSKDKEFQLRNSSPGDEDASLALAKLTDRVMLALDPDWLKKLEELVEKDPKSSFITTYVRCCIYPNLNLNGTASCKLIRNKAEASAAAETFKCPSGLIYNMQFGGGDEPPTK